MGCEEEQQFDDEVSFGNRAASPERKTCKANDMAETKLIPKA